MFTNEEILVDVKNQLEKAGIRYWLDTGNLLEYMRGDKIKHNEEDGDLGMDMADYWKARDLFDSLPEYGFKYIWPHELGIYHKANPNYHVDLWGYTFDEARAYLHDYVPNSFTGRYTLEREAPYKKEDLFPLQRVTYYGSEFWAPANPDAFLNARYGNWKEPKPGWTYFEAENVDKSYRQIAIIIPTFLRDQRMIECVNSIRRTYPAGWVRIYVGDQSNPKYKNAEKELFYDQIRAEGHQVYYLGYNKGLSATRNFLVQQTKEPFILIADDDFIFDRRANLDIMTEILISRRDIGLVAGQIDNRSSYSYNLVLDKAEHKLYYIKNEYPVICESLSSKAQKPKPYVISDSVLNFFLAKREVFQDIQWDDELPLVEHTDFFLRLKDTKWKVAFTSLVTVGHTHEENPEKYHKYRNATNGRNVILGKKHLTEKYGFDIISTSVKTNEFPVKLSDIGFICINLLRVNQTKECIKSLKEYAPEVAIYIADQDENGEDLQAFCEAEGVNYFKVPFDCGVSQSRNFLLRKVKEKYVMWGDNDFLFTADHGMERALKILTAKPEVGIVGGAVYVKDRLEHYERYMFYDPNSGYLIYVPIQYVEAEEGQVEDIKFQYLDLTFNYAIARREIFDNGHVRWNPDIKVRYEHSDFFLKVKQHSHLKVVYCQDLKVIHNHVPNVNSYDKLRGRRDDDQVFARTWGLKGTIDCTKNMLWMFNEGCNEKLGARNPIDNASHSSANMKKVLETPPVTTELTNLIRLLNTTGIFWFLAKESCHRAIVGKTFSLSQPVIGVRSDDDKYKLEKILADAGVSALLLTDPRVRETKICNTEHGPVPVPMPVVSYLESHYGQNWRG